MVRFLVALLIGAVGCYTSPAPASPPPESPARVTDRSPVRCPPESELRRFGDTIEQCKRRDTQQNHGPQRVRDGRGWILSESNWRDGQQDGVQRIAYPDGTLAVEEHWQAGRRTGTWRYFYRTGKPSHERDFVNDRETAHRAWDEQHRPRSLPALGTSDPCASDADCTIGYVGAECCPPQPSCGQVLGRRLVERFDDSCAGVYCGEPVPSSSCMGMMGVRAACRQGACTAVR